MFLLATRLQCNLYYFIFMWFLDYFLFAAIIINFYNFVMILDLVKY